MTWAIDTNTTPWGLLTPGQDAALRAHKGPWEYWSIDGWYTLDEPSWERAVVYRAVRPAPTPLVVDWSMIAPEYRFAAKDGDGCVYVYDERPVWYAKDDGWDSAGKGRALDHIIGAVKSWGTCAPEDSLIERPEGV